MSSEKKDLNESFYKVPLTVISDFVNTFLSMVFHPVNFFSSNVFSDRNWSRNAIKYFILAYSLLFACLVYSLKDINSTVQAELSRPMQQSISNAPALNNIKQQMNKFTQTIEEQLLNNKGSLILIVVQLVFGLTLSFYIILRVYSYFDGNKPPTIFIIVNLVSYIMGTAAILIMLPAHSYSSHFKKFIALKLNGQDHDFHTAPVILFTIICIYISYLFYIGLKQVCGLKKSVSISLFAITFIVNGLITLYFY